MSNIGSTILKVIDKTRSELRDIMNREKLIQQDTAAVIALAIHFAEEVEETLKFINQYIGSDHLTEEVTDCQLNTAKISQFLKELQSRGE